MSAIGMLRIYKHSIAFFMVEKYGNMSILEGLSITETVLNLPVSKYVITGVVGLLNIYCHM